MRVTSTTAYRDLSSELAAALARVQVQQQQLASGKKISQLSDAPADAVRVMRYASSQSDYTAWAGAAQDATRWLNSADGTLQSMSKVLANVRALATNAVNGALSDSARGALADQITALRDQAVDYANTQVDGRGLFSGFGTTAVTPVASPAPGAPTWSYTGDGGQVKRQVGPATTVTVNLPGSSVFGFDAGPGQDVFSVLDRLAAAVRSGNTTAIAAEQSTLGARADTVSQSLGTIGATQNRIDGQTTVGTSALDDLSTQRSSIEDTDIGQSSLLLAQAQTGYQAALSAAARSTMPSLASFLH